MTNTLNIAIKSVTARLLATENIQVNQTNSQTAWFDVEKRVLNLPLWDVEPYVYDMLVGHEVGHALFTPAAGWHKSIVDLGIPRSYVNVVEDARIERMVKSKYPGIVGTFNRAYSWMHEQDFFKIKDRNIFKMKLIDRINLHFKLGSSMTVPFSSLELPFIDKVGNCITFDDVVIVSKEILDFWKDNKDEIKDDLEEQFEKVITLGNDSEESDDDEASGDDDSSDTEETPEVTDGVSSPSDDEDEDEESTTKSTVGAGENNSVESDDEKSDTDSALRSAETKMLSSERGGIIKCFSEKIAMDAMIPYKTYYSAERVVYMHRSYAIGFDRWDHDTNNQVDAFREHCNNMFKKFMIDTNKAVSYMAKEFEQKKAAYQYSRAKVSNSGTLNTTTLHKYKFSEDVFKRITTLADAKSHGMIISVDMSGSMNNVLLDTFKQALNLAVFCRRVNIPFEMYGFTTSQAQTKEALQAMEDTLLDGMVDPGNFGYIQFFSHKMNKKEFDNAVKQVFMSGCGITNNYDSLGSTPTNEMLISLKYLLKKFRKETGVQKVTNIVLSDGEPNRCCITNTDPSVMSKSYNLLQLSNTKVVRVYNTGNDLSTNLLLHIKQECDVTNLGYFLGDHGSLRNLISRAASSNYTEMQSIKSDLRKTNGHVRNNFAGYDRYIVLKSSSIGIDDGEFAVSEDATKSTIGREFTKFSKSKRASRILLDQFVQAVA